MNEELSGAKKAAILMTLIGEDAAAGVLSKLEPIEVRQITMEIAGIEMIDPSRYEMVLSEFHGLVSQARGLERAGPGLARKLLAKAHPDQADMILDEIAPRQIRDQDDEAGDVAPPELPETLVGASSRRLATLLQDEQPQTVALVLSLLPPRKSARLLAVMDQEVQIEITRRMASISEIRPDVVDQVGATLERRLVALCEEPIVPLNGVQIAADALTNLGRSTGQEIVDSLGESFPELSAELRDLLFTFDMLRDLDDRGTQELLKQIDRSRLALALKGADPMLEHMFMQNMSERAAQMLREEMEFLGAPKLAEIEAAQREIIELVLKLEKEGAITLEEQAVAAG